MRGKWESWWSPRYYSLFGLLYLNFFIFQIERGIKKKKGGEQRKGNWLLTNESAEKKSSYLNFIWKASLLFLSMKQAHGRSSATRQNTDPAVGRCVHPDQRLQKGEATICYGGHHHGISILDKMPTLRAWNKTSLTPQSSRRSLLVPGAQRA